MRRVDAALVVVLAAIAALTLAPAGGDENQVRLVPLSDIAHSVAHPFELVAVAGNVAVFVPVGFLLALRGTSLVRAVLAAAAFSAAIEVVQLAVPGRTTSVDDVLLNTAGAALGVALFRRFGSRRTGNLTYKP